MDGMNGGWFTLVKAHALFVNETEDIQCLSKSIKALEAVLRLITCFLVYFAEKLVCFSRKLEV